METGFYSINDIKAMIFSEGGKFFFVGNDLDGNFIEIEFTIVKKDVDGWIVNVCRYYTSYDARVTEILEVNEILDTDFNFLIPKEDFGSIRRKSRFL